MKLDFLKTLQEVQPCGLRAIIEVLDESYPVMAYSDWKELAVQLIDAGFIKRQGNGQYNVTPAGKEAIAKGKEFLEDALGSDQESDEPEGDHGEPSITGYDMGEGDYHAETEIKASSKPAPEHPWRKPLLASNPVTEEVQRKEREEKTRKAADTTTEETKGHAKESATAESITDSLSFSERSPKHDVSMKFYAWTTKSDLEKVDTDELLSRHQVLKEHLDEIKSVVNQRINSAFYPSTQRESGHV